MTSKRKVEQDLVLIGDTVHRVYRIYRDADRTKECANATFDKRSVAKRFAERMNNGEV